MKCFYIQRNYSMYTTPAQFTGSQEYDVDIEDKLLKMVPVLMLLYEESSTP